MNTLTLSLHSFSAMGTECELQLYAADAAMAEYAVEAAIAEVWRIERAYSRYLPDNRLAHINQAAKQGGRVEVDIETAGLLDFAYACFQQSGGLFDISSGLLRQAWDFNAAILPDPVAITNLLPRIGFQYLHWVSPMLEFCQPGMELDFGGIAKEYAVDRAVDVCLSQRITAGLVNLGGDLRVIGPHPDGSPWVIGICHPRQPETALGTVLLHRGAITTSGDYERFFELGGQRYCHLLNPKTGWPVSELASVTVMAEQCLVAGGLSTIAILKGRAGVAWLEKLGVPHHWLDSQCLLHGGDLLKTRAA